MQLVTRNSSYPYSINVANCNLIGFSFEVIRGIYYVINRTKRTGRRSVIALPLFRPHTNYAFDVAAEEAVKQNIVVVVAAGG